MSCCIASVERRIETALCQIAGRMGVMIRQENPLVTYRGDGMFLSALPQASDTRQRVAEWAALIEPEAMGLPVYCLPRDSGVLTFYWTDMATRRCIGDMIQEYPGEMTNDHPESCLLPPTHPLFTAQTLLPMARRYALPVPKTVQVAQEPIPFETAWQAMEGAWTIARNQNNPARLERWCIRLAQRGHALLGIPQHQITNAQCAVLYAAAYMTVQALYALHIPAPERL